MFQIVRFCSGCKPFPIDDNDWKLFKRIGLYQPFKQKEINEPAQTLEYMHMHINVQIRSYTYVLCQIRKRMHIHIYTYRECLSLNDLQRIR